jgi:hypothetical protein
MLACSESASDFDLVLWVPLSGLDCFASGLAEDETIAKDLRRSRTVSFSGCPASVSAGLDCSGSIGGRYSIAYSAKPSTRAEITAVNIRSARAAAPCGESTSAKSRRAGSAGARRAARLSSRRSKSHSWSRTPKRPAALLTGLDEFSIECSCLLLAVEGFAAVDLRCGRVGGGCRDRQPHEHVNVPSHLQPHVPPDDVRAAR